jgi:uncharacterized protein YukE
MEENHFSEFIKQTNILLEEIQMFNQALDKLNQALDVINASIEEGKQNERSNTRI